MRNYKQQLLLLSGFLFIWANFIFAQDEPDYRERMQKIEALDLQQEELIRNYNKNKQELQETFQEQLKVLGSSKEDDEIRRDLLKKMNDKHKEIKDVFKKELQKLQEEEQALRDVSNKEKSAIVLEESQKNARVPSEAEKYLEEKRRRQEFYKRARAQDAKYGFEDKPESEQAPTNNFNMQPVNLEKIQEAADKIKIKNRPRANFKPPTN